MKPALRRVTRNPEFSFNVRKDTGPNSQYNLWHHHPEIEFLLIRGGKGIEIVGDNTRDITEGCHMIITGPYLPHAISYERADAGKEVEAIVVHFSPEVLGNTFLALPEMSPIKELFSLTTYGLSVKGNTLASMEQEMYALFEADYADRLLILLRILQRIAREKEYDLIASKGFTNNFSFNDNSRINKIYNFTFNNFQRDISISDVADQLNLSKESFCRYFKQKTGKTYVQFLMEVRIGYACKLLMENEMNVAEVCYACGYNNASNFHHQFKEFKGKTPLQYQKDYLQAAMVK
ncbi:HTH-type transcriptional activator RhaS [bioreactor metagenome]|uniref:HTH-type transcriptional activator RhaS n=1 Tax=bioreactor metagenome TaxID=1076179 RepID=A0A644V909_9ZZZZ